MSTIGSLVHQSIQHVNKAVDGITEVLINVENQGMYSDSLSRIHGDLLKVQNKLHSWEKKEI